MSRYPAISEPDQTIESLYNTIIELKQAVEILTGQRGTPETVTATTAQTFAESLITTEVSTAIASGIISLPTSTAIVYLVFVETESGAGTDDLTTINGGRPGTIVILTALDGTHDVVAKDGTGNLVLAGADFTLDTADDALVLVRRDTATWIELARANNS